MSKKSYKTKNYTPVSQRETLIVEEPVEEVIDIEPIPVFKLNDKEEPKTELAPIPILTVKVTHPSLRRRFGPSTAYDVAGIISDEGYYGIFEIKDGWGRLDNGTWINLDYTDFQKI